MTNTTKLNKKWYYVQYGLYADCEVLGEYKHGCMLSSTIYYLVKSDLGTFIVTEIYDTLEEAKRAIDEKLHISMKNLL